MLDLLSLGKVMVVLIYHLCEFDMTLMTMRSYKQVFQKQKKNLGIERDKGKGGRRKVGKEET